MTIHEQIKAARKQLKWSMKRLAKEVSDAEGLAEPLNWQTVQQWENGTSAPKRSRMELVRRLLGLDAAPATQKGDVLEALKPAERAMLLNYRTLLTKDRAYFDAEIAKKAAERADEMDEMLALIGLAAPASANDEEPTPEDQRLAQEAERVAQKGRRSHPRKPSA